MTVISPKSTATARQPEATTEHPQAPYHAIADVLTNKHLLQEIFIKALPAKPAPETPNAAHTWGSLRGINRVFLAAANSLVSVIFAWRHPGGQRICPWDQAHLEFFWEFTGPDASAEFRDLWQQHQPLTFLDQHDSTEKKRKMTHHRHLT